MKTKDVFTPGRFPTHTFVDTHLRDKEQQLLDTLDAGAMLVSISGPSKSGKTVFVEQCLGRECLIQVTGAGVGEPDDLWMRVFDIIGTPLPQSATSGAASGRKVGGSGSLEGNALIAKGKASASVENASSESSLQTSKLPSDSLQLLIREIGKTEWVVFIDDFHYIPREVQSQLARQIKEAIRSDVKFICASVPYHADDVIRGNPDLRGRVFSLDFEYWGDEVLKQIAYKGFPALNIEPRQSVIEKLAAEAAGSPQLMQYLCLNSCYELGVRETTSAVVEFPHEPALFENICRRTVQSADYGSVVEKMKEGPKTRGSDRRIYQTRFGWQGDIYRLLAKALSLDPPQLTFRYASLSERVVSMCRESSPSGSSITSACAQSAKIVNDSLGERIVEWDGDSDVFDIRDPYFLFYLRWSETTDS